jgi:TRAP-type C4-dicarboxylate transport system permease small subunit
MLPGGGDQKFFGAASFSYFTLPRSGPIYPRISPNIIAGAAPWKGWSGLSNSTTKIGRIIDRIVDAFAFAAGLVLTFILLSVCLEVIMRYFLNRPLQWVIEITEYALLYITFLGTAWLLKREGHITVDVILVRLSPKTRAILGIFSSVIGVIVCVCFVWYGTEVAWDHFRRGVYNPTVLEFPKAPIIAIIPIGSLVLLVQFLRRGYGFLIGLLHDSRRGASTDH